MDSRSNKRKNDDEDCINNSVKRKTTGEPQNLDGEENMHDREENMNKDDLREEENHNLKKRILELEKQITEANTINERSIKEISDLTSMVEKSEKEKDDILDYLGREVTCPVCLMIPRNKRIPICRNGHTTCETCKSRNCPVCRTRMEDDMFSPLTQNIADLLAVPCIFMDQGCTIKLKKNKIVNHEKGECKYRELMCPGCKEKIQARTIPDHFRNCTELDFSIEDLKFDEKWTVRNFNHSIESCMRIAYKLESSENWFLLCTDRLEDKLVFCMKHYSAENRKEAFSYNLKVSNTGKEFSRSMNGECTPIEMEIKDARREGYTLDISVEFMERKCLLPNTVNEYKWDIEFSFIKN